ncbi:HORMA domain protein [Ceratobasidium sp. AG-Ba]|nr:HORMA domain protein [Ceratobasidium sp. AG-Ba]
MLKVRQKTKVATDQNQEVVTAAASLQAVKTLFSAGIGCITFIRGLLSEDNFETQSLTSARDPTVAEFVGPQNNPSNVKVKTIKRGFSTEADTLLDYLDNGIFDALEKQFLKSFVFAIYLIQTSSLIESYTFNVTYHEVGSTRVPTLTLETTLSKLSLDSEDALTKAARDGRSPTLGDVKKRDAEKDRFFFATHNVDEGPERASCGEINVGAHLVRLEVASICSQLPLSEDHTGTFTGLSSAQTFDEVGDKRRANADAQRVDAENRQVVWNADPLEEDAPGRADSDEQIPLGVRKGDKVIPIPSRVKEKEIVRHRAGKHRVPALGDASSSDAAQVEEATQIIETQATVVVPQTQSETQMEVDAAQPFQQDDEDVHMNEGEAPAAGAEPSEPASTPAIDADVIAGRRIHPAIDPVVLRWKQVDYRMERARRSSAKAVVKGGCMRVLDRFETAEEAGHSEDPICVDCIVRSDMVYDIMSENSKHQLEVELNILAIYRRTLKLVYEKGLPGNPHQLQKLVGCTRQDAIKNLKRMENEGFIEARVIQLDALGLVASNVLAKNAKTAKKPNKKNQGKPQLVLVKSAATTRKLKRYFEPQGEIVKELVKLCRPTKDKVPPLQTTRAGNVLVPSSSANIASQEPTSPTLRGTSPGEESQTQQETQTFVERATPRSVTPVIPQVTPQAPSAPSKRRTSNRLAENRAKKMKISLAKQGVDLETYD